jgi:type I restriction enzyme R subunit
MQNTNLNENKIEEAFVQMLQEVGWEYAHGPSVAPYSEGALRENFTSPLLEKVLLSSLEKINPNLPSSAIHEAYNKITNLGTGDMMTLNEKFHTMLCEGVDVNVFENGNDKGVKVKVVDMENITANNFLAVNQFVIRENNNEKRLDVVLFVNGLPLVVAELKNASDENAGLESAYRQIQTYKAVVPSMFSYNALCVISDGVDARVSTVSAPFGRYLAWKSPIKTENGKVPELQIMAEKMLLREVLLKLVRYNTVFETEEKKDEKTGLFSLVKIKKVAAYHQYYAVEKAVQETLRATHEENGDRKVGVVWHTQGSGKSLSMVFYTGQIVVEPEMKNPTVVILTDRNDLDDQLFATFGNCTSLLRQKPMQARDREHLKELLKVASGGIVFTTIQKFFPEEGKNIYDTLSERKNIVVVADEAHRSQYGFNARLIEDEDGSSVRYGNAKYLRDALPNASFIGFTGTPIERDDRDTKKVFGEYIDIYDISQAVKDGATVPISYESRLIKIKMNEGVGEEIDRMIDGLKDATEEQKENAKKRNSQIDAIVGNPERLKDLAKDIVVHFEERRNVFQGKAMIVAMTRKIAINLYNEIIALRPHWENDDLMKGVLKVVITSSSSDGPEFAPHRTSKEDRQKLAARIKDVKDELEIVIVQSMWLTGFDAPILNTMYIDKKMQGANLMQAIARVNRVYMDKPGGLIVDYIGIGQDLRNAMRDYTESGGEGEAVLEIENAIKGMREKLEVVNGIMHGYDYKKYFEVDTREKLQILLDAQNYVLENEERKERFVREVTALSKFFIMVMPLPEAEEIKDAVAFLQAVKSRIAKFNSTGNKMSDREVETAIKQIVDEALSSAGVIDVFDAAGIEKPSLNILSEEFLLEVKNMKHKNLAYELLKKLLNDEVKVRKDRNVVMGRKFSEMLGSVVKRYHNNQIDTAKVLEELCEIAKEMKEEDAKAKDLGLTDEEYAFYTVLATNESTKFLDDQKMKELINTIVDTVRKNATVDWYRKENVRAQLRLTVKKILMKYGYPPDLARMEADRVLEQSELLATENNY